MSSERHATSADGMPGGSTGSSHRASLRLWILLAVPLLLIWLRTCALFVDESEVVVIERLGTVTAVLDQPDDRGLNFKLPWPIGTARRFDRRIQLFDPAGREVFTRDRKNVTVDAWVCWKISDSGQDQQSLNERPAVKFFRTVGTGQAAQARLETRLRSTLAARTAEVELSELMQATTPDSGPVGGQDTSLETVSQRLLADMRQRPDEEESVTSRLGIEIVDVRIKRIGFPAGNQQAVFERMRSERQKIADGYRSAGLAQNTVIRSQADRQYNEIMARAEGEAERIRGQAEAEALAILNAAHARDPEFYQFSKTLETYRSVLQNNTTLVLSASSSLLKLLVNGLPESSRSTTPTPTATDNTPPSPPAQQPGESAVSDSADGVENGVSVEAAP